jgi:cobalt-zinc-cadmium efflux system protein
MHSHDHDHHDHSHGGHHHHALPEVVNNAFIAGIVLNSLFVVIQVIVGLTAHSMALLADAGHNLGDVASLILSLVALRLAKAKPTDVYTYGYKKTTILASLTNAVVLFITIGILGFESFNRLLHPQPVAGGLVAIVAGIGIAINLASAFLFFRNKEHDLNTKGAYLHLLTDAMVSMGVVVAGIIIRYTGWYWLDGATSIIILIVILFGTWSLLTASLRLSLDAVPNDISPEKIEKVINKVPGVHSVHHMHIWAMSTTQNALTAHLVVTESLKFDEKMKVIHEVKHQLMHNKIHHATIELESEALPCPDDDC